MESTTIDIEAPPGAYLFDVDGTIFRVEHHYRDFYKYALIALGMPTVSTEWWKQVLSCFGLAEHDAAACMCNVANLLGIGIDPALLILTKTQMLETAFDSGGLTVDFMEGAENLLNQASLSGRPLALCSGSNGHFIMKLMREAGIDHKVSASVFAEDYRPNAWDAKPSPHAYLGLTRLLNVNPADCYAFEDTPAGMVAALRANVGRVFVSRSYLSEEEFNEHYQSLRTRFANEKSNWDSRIVRVKSWKHISIAH